MFIKGIEDLVRLVLDLLQILVGNLCWVEAGGRMVSAVPLLRFYMMSGFSNEACFNIVVAVDTRSGRDYLLAELEDEGLGFYLEEA